MVKRVVLNGPETSLKLSLGLAAVACILRPTNALIWATLGAFLYFRAPMRAERILIITEVAKIGYVYTYSPEYGLPSDDFNASECRQ